MAPDPRHCFDCDLRLDAPTRRRPAIPAMSELPSRHTYPRSRARRPRNLGATEVRWRHRSRVPLPGWPTDITLVDREMWGRFSELSIVEVPGPNPSAAHPRALHGSPSGTSRPANGPSPPISTRSTMGSGEAAEHPAPTGFSPGIRPSPPRRQNTPGGSTCAPRHPAPHRARQSTFRHARSPGGRVTARDPNGRCMADLVRPQHRRHR